MRLLSFLILIAVCAIPQTTIREVVYANASWSGEIVPLFDKGYLIYVREGNGIAVFRPNGALAFTRTLPCPGSGACSFMGVAMDSDGSVALTVAFYKPTGQTAGILTLSP